VDHHIGPTGFDHPYATAAVGRRKTLYIAHYCGMTAREVDGQHAAHWMGHIRQLVEELDLVRAGNDTDHLELAHESLGMYRGRLADVFIRTAETAESSILRTLRGREKEFVFGQIRRYGADRHIAREDYYSSCAAVNDVCVKLSLAISVLLHDNEHLPQLVVPLTVELHTYFKTARDSLQGATQRFLAYVEARFVKGYLPAESMVLSAQALNTGQ